MLPREKEEKIQAAIQEYLETENPSKKGIANKHGIPESTLRGRLKVEGLTEIDSARTKTLPKEKEEKLQSAIQEFLETENASKKGIANKHGIPESTLRGRLKARGITKEVTVKAKTLPKEKEEKIQAAIQEYLESEDPSKKGIAKKYGIPESTLRGRLKGTENRTESHIKQQRLTNAQEVVLAAKIAYLVDGGTYPGKQKVEEVARELLAEAYDELVADNAKPSQSKGDYTYLSSKWFYGFLRRHSSLNYRKVQVVDVTHPIEADSDESSFYSE